MIDDTSEHKPKVVPFKDILDALLDDEHPFPARFLHRFSDLPPAELKALRKAWPNISSRRKETLLDDLENLSETDTLTSFDELARGLLVDPEPGVRSAAIRLLWESEDFRLVPVFLEMLTGDKDAGTRATAANVLGQFVYLGELDKIPAEMKKTIEDQLLSTASSGEEALVRRRAVESLGYSGREEVIPLIEAASREKSPDWLASALFAMGRSCDSRWSRQVLDHLHAVNDEVRSEAVHAAGELELKAARPILLDMLEDEEDPDIRREIIWALSNIGGEGVRAKLEELLEMEEEDETAEFIEDAIDTLSFTEGGGPFDMIDIDPDGDFIEDDANGEG